jgi:hypothetical protein
MNSVQADLEGIRQRLQERLRELEQQLNPLQIEATKVRTQLDLVKKALTTENPPPVQQDGRGTTVPRNAISGLLERILSEAAQPLHISEIRKRYLAAGNEIPGQGTESNLLVYMVRDPRFIRISKGTYSLAASGIAPIKTKTKRRRRRKKSGGQRA